MFGGTSAEIHPGKPPLTISSAAWRSRALCWAAPGPSTPNFAASVYPTLVSANFDAPVVKRPRPRLGRAHGRRGNQQRIHCAAGSAAGSLPRPQPSRRVRRSRSTSVCGRRAARPSRRRRQPEATEARRGAEAPRPRSAAEARGSAEAEGTAAASAGSSCRAPRRRVAAERKADEASGELAPRHGAARQGGGDVDRFRRQADHRRKAVGQAAARRARCWPMLPPTPA